MAWKKCTWGCLGVAITRPSATEPLDPVGYGVKHMLRIGWPWPISAVMLPGLGGGRLSSLYSSWTFMSGVFLSHSKLFVCDSALSSHTPTSGGRWLLLAVSKKGKRVLLSTVSCRPMHEHLMWYVCVWILFRGWVWVLMYTEFQSNQE